MIPRTRLKYLRSLRRRKVRAAEGLLLLEGLHVVEEAVAAGQARELLVADAAAAGARTRALLDAGLPVTRLAPGEVAALAATRTPAGVFAVARDPCRPLAPGDLPDEGIVLLAAGVADPGNLGTLVRTAAALGAAAVVATAGSVDPANPKVVRATAGALFRLPVRRAEAAAVGEAGYALLLAAADGTPVGALRSRPARVALVVGNEPRGIAPEVAARAAGSVAVPLARGVESLNVAVATGILLHALAGLPVER